MEMIIGGAFQGKSAYAKKRYPQIVWEEAAALDETGLLKAEGILGFHEYVRKELEAGRSVDGLAEKLIRCNSQAVLVCDEVGCGVVPVDALDREYREKTGRICTALAQKADRVLRIFCGIGTVIKDA